MAAAVVAARRTGERGDLPVRIIRGKEDAWQVVDWAYRLRDAIPGSSLHVLEQCGHFVMDGRPDRIAGLINDFVAEHGG